MKTNVPELMYSASLHHQTEMYRAEIERFNLSVRRLKRRAERWLATHERPSGTKVGGRNTGEYNAWHKYERMARQPEHHAMVEREANRRRWAQNREQLYDTKQARRQARAARLKEAGKPTVTPPPWHKPGHKWYEEYRSHRRAWELLRQPQHPCISCEVNSTTKTLCRQCATEKAKAASLIARAVPLDVQLERKRIRDRKRRQPSVATPSSCQICGSAVLKKSIRYCAECKVVAQEQARARERDARRAAYAQAKGGEVHPYRRKAA